MSHTSVSPIDQAAEQLNAGGVVAYPAEGVWGLGCLPLFEKAVQRVLALKERAAHHGLILIASKMNQIRPYFAVLSHAQEKTLSECWPGPVTYLVPKSALVAGWITGEHNTVAVRIPALEHIGEICDRVQGPIVSTSANPNGLPPAVDIQTLHAYFPTGIDYIFPGEVTATAGASEIRDLCTGRVIRPGRK